MTTIDIRMRFSMNFKPKLSNYEFLIPKDFNHTIRKIKKLITNGRKLIIRLSNNLGNQMFMFAAVCYCKINE